MIQLAENPNTTSTTSAIDDSEEQHANKKQFSLLKSSQSIIHC